MRLRSALYLFLLLLIAVFVLANWKALATPTDLNLLITAVRAPAAVVGLLFFAAVLSIDWGIHAVHRRAWARERRALGQEVEHLRAQAEQAEASRLRALQETLERETSRIREKLDQLIAHQASAPAQRQGE